MGWFKNFFRSMGLKIAVEILEEVLEAAADLAQNEIDELPSEHASNKEKAFMKEGVDLVVARALAEVRERI
jgi:hypothetical protein